MKSLLIFLCLASTTFAQTIVSGTFVFSGSVTPGGGGGGSGTVTDVSVVTANGISGSVATSTTTPAITLSLGAITPTSIAIGSDPADAGVIRLENAAVIGWESSPAGTDVTLTVNSSEQFVFSNAILSPTIVTGVLGSSTATTQSAGDNSTKVATTAYVDTATSGPHSITFVIDGGNTPLTATAGKMIPTLFAGTLKKYKMVCQPSGSITCDILRSAQGAGIPSASIVGAGTKPVISASTEGSIVSTFASYTSTTITEGDNFILNPTTVDGVVTYVCLTLYFQ